MENLEDEYAIGLDLGTTFSCIGVYRNGGVEIIPNTKGEKTTPSIVIITNVPGKDELKILVGEETTDYLVKNYDSCIYEIKRLIGRNYSDKELNKEIQKLPFKIIKAEKGDFPEVELNINGKYKKYRPVEICSFIIKKMIKNAEIYLNKIINKLVITVPAYFNDSQRKLTKQAAELVGLKVIRVINEPTAAALCYVSELDKNINQKILVFDLGGGTFDVSILDIFSEEDVKYFKVLSTSGDTQLGGEDFDNELVNFFLSKSKSLENEIKKAHKVIKKLKIACEKVKKILSKSQETIIRVNNFYNNGEDLIAKISREEFNKICKPHFDKFQLSLNKALSDANLKKEDISQIILVGGSTKIPRVREIVEEFFPDCKINKYINPDEAVVYGATIEAEIMLHDGDRDIDFLDITPLSLGTNVLNHSIDPDIKKEGDEMRIIIKRGTPVPTLVQQTFYRIWNSQKTPSIEIYEGEKKYVKYNHLLKKSMLIGLDIRNKQTKVIVQFEIDTNGILNIKAKEESENNDGKTKELLIKNDEISLNPEEIENLKEKNKELVKKIDFCFFSDMKDTLKEYKEAYENTQEVDDKILIKMNYNNILEEFIDTFDKQCDKDILLEKQYLYVKELFSSYIETLNLSIDKGDQINIFNNINKYIQIFIDKTSGYLNDLLNVIEKLKQTRHKMEFYRLVIFIMKELNELGQKSTNNKSEFCKYHSLLYFEQSEAYYEKYLSDIKTTLLKPSETELLKMQINMCKEYISDIKSSAIFK